MKEGISPMQVGTDKEGKPIMDISQDVADTATLNLEITKKEEALKAREAASAAANGPMYGMKGMRTEIEKKLFLEKFPGNEDLL